MNVEDKYSKEMKETLPLDLNDSKIQCISKSKTETNVIEKRVRLFQKLDCSF